MTGFNEFLVVVGAMFLLLITGFIMRKVNVIDDTSSNRLSALIIKLAQPVLIVSSLISAERSVDNLILGGKMLLIGILLHGFMALIAYFSCKGFKDFDERKISEFSMIFGNCGFLGFPIFEALFPDKGLFLGAFLVISFHLVLWTWGIAILGRKRPDIKLTVKKIFINLGTVPSAIGMVLYLALLPFPELSYPEFIVKSCNYIGSLCTPISMLVTGALIATKPIKSLLTSGKLYYTSVLKLFVIPLIICTVMSLLGFDDDMIKFCTIAAALPSASTVSMLAELHKISPSYASQSVGFSTLISLATMPCVMLIAPKIIEIL